MINAIRMLAGVTFFRNIIKCRHFKGFAVDEQNINNRISKLCLYCTFLSWYCGPTVFMELYRLNIER